MALQEQRDVLSSVDMDPIAKLPYELWELILQKIPIYQLTVVAQVSKPFTQVVRNLSVWQDIWKKAGLPDQSTGVQKQDFYAVVLTYSKYICEGCYCYCTRRYCFWHSTEWPCHSRSYSQRASEMIQNASPIDETLLCQSCEQLRAQLRDQRHKDLEHHIKSTLGCTEFNTHLLPTRCLPYVMSGNRRDIKITMDFISRESIHMALEKALPDEVRRSKLEFKLQKRKLELREDSQLCNGYIRTGGTKSVDVIVETMAEMDWLHKQTQYGTLCRGKTRICMFRLPTFRYKKMALGRYIRSRFESNQWNHVEDDPDTPLRPPRSLWKLIEKLSPHVCVDYAQHCISLAPSINALDDSHTLTNEQLIQQMDDGAKLVRGSTLVSSSSSLQLSQKLKHFLGESSFNSLLVKCRERSINWKKIEPH